MTAITVQVFIGGKHIDTVNHPLRQQKDTDFCGIAYRRAFWRFVEPMGETAAINLDGPSFPKEDAYIFPHKLTGRYTGEINEANGNYNENKNMDFEEKTTQGLDFLFEILYSSYGKAPYITRGPLQSSLQIAFDILLDRLKQDGIKFENEIFYYVNGAPLRDENRNVACVSYYTYFIDQMYDLIAQLESTLMLRDQKFADEIREIHKSLKELNIDEISNNMEGLKKQNFKLNEQNKLFEALLESQDNEIESKSAENETLRKNLTNNASTSTISRRKLLSEHLRYVYPGIRIQERSIDTILDPSIDLPNLYEFLGMLTTKEGKDTLSSKTKKWMGADHVRECRFGNTGRAYYDPNPKEDGRLLVYISQKSNQDADEDYIKKIFN